MTTSTRQSTLLNASSGPPDWRGLLDRHGDYLYGQALLRVRDAAIAENVVLETLLAAEQAPENHHSVSPEVLQSERSWLARIMKRKLLEQYREVYKAHDAQNTAAAGQGDDLFEHEGEWAGHWREEMAPTDWEMDATSRAARKKFWIMLSRCLSELSPKTAIAFTLREIEELSTEQICELLDISASDLWKTLHRARLQLSHLFTTELPASLGKRGKIGRSFPGPTRPNVTTGPQNEIKYLSTMNRCSAVRIFQ